MKKVSISLIAALLFMWMAGPAKVFAQTATPPPNGEVSGKIIDQNQEKVVRQSLDIMLHIWDQNDAAINMLHAQSATDGTYRFESVDLQPQYLYAVMATFDDVTYQSQALSPTNGSNQLNLDVPVYETTKDASAVQIGQMHVLFNFAEDGLETTEIYILSNTGQRTVKDAITLEDGKLATLSYPLPTNADYIFFQPDDQQDRFIKFAGGFADTSPLFPGEQADQYAVQYMVPLKQGQTYSYTAPLDIKAMNFLLPQDAGVTLKGDGLAGPEPLTPDNGKTYAVYSYRDVHSGQTVSVTFSGKPTLSANNQSNNLNLPIAVGGGLLGVVMIGAALWWWRRPDDYEEEEEVEEDQSESAFDELITQIAQLDEAHARGELDEEQYQQKRTRLRDDAKSMLEKSPTG